MPTYKTHSIHGETILPDIDKRIEIDKEDFKIHCFGFDSLIFSDYELFKQQHLKDTKLYFETLLNSIKSAKLQDNSEVMSFLYGQLDHFILDMVMHPLIFYMTEGLKKEHLIGYHGLIEMWLDDYLIKKYHVNDTFYYHRWQIRDNDLKSLIRDVYKIVYDKSKMILKYDLGLSATNIYDSLARRNAIRITPIICKLINLGDIVNKEDLDRILPFLNLDNGIWFNPETCEEKHESIDDLWEKATEISLDTIYDVNKFLYDDKPLSTHIIKDNLSANTGLPCDVQQQFKLIKKY